MKVCKVDSPLCEPHEMSREALELIAIIKSQPNGKMLRNAVEYALANMVNSGEIAVWSGIDCFLKELIASGQCRSDLLPGVRAVQDIIGESYGDVLTRLREKMHEEMSFDEAPSEEQIN